MSVIHATPPIPSAMSDTGIPQRNLLNLMLKFMHIEGLRKRSRKLAGRMKLPHRVVQQLLDDRLAAEALTGARLGRAAALPFRSAIR